MFEEQPADTHIYDVCHASSMKILLFVNERGAQAVTHIYHYSSIIDRAPISHLHGRCYVYTYTADLSIHFT